MVTAGIFMVSRMSPLYELSDTALNFILVIGSITALFMGILGIIQNDIKRVIAYSTLSQLGYMTIALGVSAYSVAVFHLMTHAFFKALLFLGAGSVIMGMHHNQDIRWMGGVRKYMPITWITFLLGNLALIGTPFFSGFYSKDAIIEAVHASTCLLPALPTLRCWPVCSSRLSTRSVCTSSSSTARSATTRTPMPTMTTTVMTTTAMATMPSRTSRPGGDRSSGAAGHSFGGDRCDCADAHAVWRLLQGRDPRRWLQAWRHGRTGREDPRLGAHGLHGFTAAPFWLALAGVVVSYVFYMVKPEIPAAIMAFSKKIGLYQVLEGKYGVDWVNENIFARGSRAFGTFFWKAGDQAIIDGAIVNGSWKLVAKFGQWCAACKQAISITTRWS
jgi:NADH-quinone oxidoreductase subunit L